MLLTQFVEKCVQLEFILQETQSPETETLSENIIFLALLYRAEYNNDIPPSPSGTHQFSEYYEWY